MPQRRGVPRGLSAIVPLAVFSEVADTRGASFCKSASRMQTAPTRSLGLDETRGPGGALGFAGVVLGCAVSACQLTLGRFYGSVSIRSAGGAGWHDSPGLRSLPRR